MGDLLKDTYVYSTLAKNYNNFLNPAIKIKVGEKDIKETLKVGITNVTVTLSDESAGSADFSIVNVYELKSSSFTTNVMNTLKLGETITVELGYTSALTEVFSGYIDTVDMEFAGMPVITVKALDVRRIMMQNAKEFTYKEKKASDIVTEITQGYAKFTKKDITASTDTTTKEKPLKYIQNTNDFSFIQMLGRLTKMEFLVVVDKAYFRKMHTKDDSAIMTLEKGNGLISFSCSKSYCDEKIKVFGHAENTDKDVTVEKEVSSDKNCKAMMTKKPVTEIREAMIEDKTVAENVAEYEMNKILETKQTGSGSCIGLPELIPGRYLKLDKLETEVNKKYYLKQVVHSFGTDGFTTSFTIGSWV